MPALFYLISCCSFDEDFLNAIPSILPSLTDAFHRFIDSDSNGSISKEEIEDMILLLVNLKPVLEHIPFLTNEELVNGDQKAADLIEFLDDCFHFLGGTKQG
jgi:hypothetical protein